MIRIHPRYRCCLDRPAEIYLDEHSIDWKRTTKLVGVNAVVNRMTAPTHKVDGYQNESNVGGFRQPCHNELFLSNGIDPRNSYKKKRITFGEQPLRGMASSYQHVQQKQTNMSARRRRSPSSRHCHTGGIGGRRKY